MMNMGNLLWYSNHLEDIEADVDEDWAGEVSLQHLVSLLAVSLLSICFEIILIIILLLLFDYHLIIIWLSFDYHLITIWSSFAFISSWSSHCLSFYYHADHRTDCDDCGQDVHRSKSQNHKNKCIVKNTTFFTKWSQFKVWNFEFPFETKRRAKGNRKFSEKTVEYLHKQLATFEFWKNRDKQRNVKSIETLPEAQLTHQALDP